MLTQFIKSIAILTAATFPVWILFRIVFNALKKRGGNTSFGRELILALFFLYVMFVLAVTIVPVPISQFRDPTARDFNILPVVNTAREFIATLNARRSYMTGHSLTNILGNIVLFLPLGIFLPLAAPKYRSLKKVTIVAFFCSLAIEVLQYISTFWGSYRSVDIDDIILNTLGAFVGFVVFDKLLMKLFKARRKKSEI